MKLQYPPGPSGGLLGLGNAIHYKIDPLGFLKEAAKTYGDVVYLQMGQTPIYLLNHPEFVQQVFLNDWQKFKKPELIKISNRGYWGDGLTSLEGDAWQRRRRLVQPAFHQHRIATLAQSIVECSRDMVKGWQPGEMINIDEAMLTVTARVATRVLFDAELESHGSAAENEKRSGVIPLEEALGVDFTTIQSGADSSGIYLTRRRAGQKMNATLNIIQEHFAAPKMRNDMLSFLLNATHEDGSPMTHEEVIGEILQMFFAGHHTIPTTLIWLWYALSQNPEVERSVHEELDQMLGGQLPSLEDLPNLPYGEMVIKETLRFYSPTVALVRETVEEVHVGGYTLEKGASIWVSPYLLHHDPRNFEQPERFWPERFSQENIKQIPKYAYLPFGVGPRICIGHAFSMLVIRLILATVAHLYRLVLAPDQVIVPKLFLTMRPEKEIYMQVEERMK